MDFERQLIIDKLTIMKKHNFNKVVYKDDEPFDKNVKKSIEARQDGNRWFAKKNHDEKIHEEIWKLYTRSIAFAPTGSEELAAGFANRSVFLLHLKKYKDALLDIQRSLKITNSSSLKVKLFCRQAECFVALQEGKKNSSLEKAKYWFNKVDNEGENLRLDKMIKKVQRVMEENIPDYLEKEKKNDLTCKNDGIAITYNKKFGRGLVATRDFEPGESVYIEKFYAVSVNKSKTHAYCSHCLGISWTLIPCDHCAYNLYCSEKCKVKAWEKYHDIECHMKYINLCEDSYVTYFIELGIRSLIMGIKESGSIEELRSWINEVDNYKNTKIKGFSKNKCFSNTSFKNLCSLKSCKNVQKIEILSVVAITAMQSLADNAEIFGKTFQHYGKELEQHEDVLFIACLLLRLMCTFVLNAFYVQPLTEVCAVTGNFTKCLQSFCCGRGMSISLITSLINHSCDNNVNRIYTNDGKVIYYATKPIKQNSQIFSSYYFDYTWTEKDSRRMMLSSLFEFHCDCLACQQDWPTARSICRKYHPGLHSCSAKYNKLTLEIIKKNGDIITGLDNRSNNYSKKEIQSLAKDIMIVNAQKTQKPNVATAAFHSAFHTMMETRYFDRLKIPNACDINENVGK